MIPKMKKTKNCEPSEMLKEQKNCDANLKFGKIVRMPKINWHKWKLMMKMEKGWRLQEYSEESLRL